MNGFIFMFSILYLKYIQIFQGKKRNLYKMSSLITRPNARSMKITFKCVFSNNTLNEHLF